MELSEVLELVKAGYTKDEIEQMAHPQTHLSDAVPAVEPVENTEPIEEPVPAQFAERVADSVPEAVPEAVPQPQQAQVETKTTLDDVMMGIAKLTSAIQANAIAQSVIPGGLSEAPKAEDMLAEIIRPTYKEREP